MLGDHVELQRGVTGYEIEIDENRAPFTRLRQMPGQARCDGCVAGAAANADHVYEPPGAHDALIEGADQNGLARARDEAADQRFKEIFGNADILQVPIENDVVVVADNDHACPGFANLGELANGGDTVFGPRDVDDEQPA